MADEPEISVLTLLRRLDEKFDRLSDTVDRLNDEVATHTRMLDMLQQDATLIRGVLTGHTRTLDILLQDTRMVRGAVNDMAKETVTAGEVEAIHHDLNRLQQQVSELTARLEIVEGRDRH